jgi:hypothetical protein
MLPVDDADDFARETLPGHSPPYYETRLSCPDKLPKTSRNEGQVKGVPARLETAPMPPNISTCSHPEDFLDRPPLPLAGVAVGLIIILNLASTVATLAYL